MITSFKTSLNGLDKFSVNSFIYDMEAKFIEDIDAIERQKREQETELSKKQNKIQELEAKIEELKNLQKYIENSDKIVEISRLNIYEEKQKSIDEINSFYDQKNQKLQNDINILNEDIEKAKKTFEDIMSKVYLSLNKAFDVKVSDRRNLIGQDKENDNSSDSEEKIIGKIVQNIIKDNEDNIIVSKGDVVTSELVEWARQNDRVIELISNVE